MSLLFLILSIVFADPINYNLDLVSIVEYENDNNNYGISDIWGYTDEDGNEYAIIGYRYGTSIVDVSTTPNNPIEVADIPGPSNGDVYYHRDYKTFGDYLYIVNEMSGADMGMQVVDLSPLPESPPQQVNTYTNIQRSHNLWIDDNGLVFIEHYSGDNIHIANLNSSPDNPTYAGTFGNLGQACHDIYTRDNIAYISEGWNGRYGIYDISDLNNITHLETITPMNSGYAHNAWLNDSGTHLVTTEETIGKTMKIWDVSDFNNITLAGEYIGENGLAHNAHIKDDLVYVSHYSVGIKIIDIYNPEDPIEVAAYDTYPQNNGTGWVGCWGAYPFTNNNMVFASDIQNGLFVLDFEPKYAGWVQGTLYLDSNNILSNATLKSVLNNKEYLTDENGYFNIGFANGSYEFEVYHQSQLVDTIVIDFMPREIINLDIIINQDDDSCPEGYYEIEENSCCTDGTYNECCGAYGWTQPSSCSGGDPNFQPSYAYCGSGGCYVWCPAVCQPDPAYNDCNGDHMGDAVYDECGVCDGDGSTCLDDCGIPNGDNSTCADDCGVPNGDNSTCADCAGTPNGNAEEDVCGVCNGFGINPNGWQVATDGSTSQNPLYCQWSSYTENVDWAYGTSGTFEECAAECEATSGCTGFEHGGGYCSFWFNGACVNDDWQNSLGIEYNNDTATGWENSGILTYWYTGQCDCDDSIIDACGECGGDNVSCGIIVGDINFDGSINVIDVVILVDVILDNAQNNLSDEEFFAADFNADGVLNVIDVVPLVNSILNQE